MARYGRDFDDRWNGFGGGMDRGGFRGEYGGMRSDAGRQGRGLSGFGGGGGSYDHEFGAGRGGLGRGYGSEFGGGMGRGGMRGGEAGLSGGYGGGSGMGESEWNRGRGMGRGGMGAGGMGSGRELGGYGGSEWNRGGGNDWNRGGGWAGGTGQRDWHHEDDDQKLRRMRASEVMTDNPETVTPDASLADAARKMRDLDVGIIPVVESSDSRRLRGVITDRDIAVRAVAEGSDPRETKVSQCMTTEVESCNKNDSLSDVLRVMERSQVRRVPITDREGRLVGIVAQADVITDVDDHRGEHRVVRAVERISEPAEPRRGGMRGGRSRSGGAGNGMLAGGQNQGDMD